MLNVYKAVRFGILWGLLAVLIALIVYFLRPIAGFILEPLDAIGLNLAWFAIMMAGVHFGARSGYRGWLVSLFGGGLSGFIAALFLVIVSYFLPILGEASLQGSLIVLATAFIVGI